MFIEFIFTDWQRFMTKQNPDYPQERLKSHRIELMSLAETENWIMAKLRNLEEHALLDEPDLPRCTDKDLWRSDPVWKYYANLKNTTGRSSKNLKTAAEAADYKASKGGKGVIIEVPGQVKACGYCPAFEICTQKDEYDHD